MKIKMKFSKENILVVLYLFVLMVGLAMSYQSDDHYVNVFAMPGSKKTVVIDAGHGGWDPGKVAGSNIYEKDINVSIALKLQQYLEQGDFTVLMTRVDDNALGTSKNSDLNGRKQITNTTDGDIMVSIHQNSFTSSSVSGSQVFYFDKSNNSEKLAQCIQAQMKEFLSQHNKKEVKANDNYYMLKQTSIPAVIVECGFLSNDAEKNLLIDDKYQQKVAWAIYAGIVDYFNTEETAN